MSTAGRSSTSRLKEIMRGRSVLPFFSFCKRNDPQDPSLRACTFPSNINGRFNTSGVFMECEVVGMGEVGKTGKVALTQIAVDLPAGMGGAGAGLYQFLYRCSYQLDRHISSRNSGGPLLDHLGRLIRIVVASAPNFGFAIPIDSVMSCAGMLWKLEKAMGSTDETMEGSTDMEIDVSERCLSNTVSYDDGEGEDETIVYDASFQEMEDNYVKYQTAQWVLYSLLLIPAWGIGFFMLLYLPMRRYISRKEFQSRKLYVTHNFIVYK